MCMLNTAMLYSDAKRSGQNKTYCYYASLGVLNMKSFKKQDVIFLKDFKAKSHVYKYPLNDFCKKAVF